MLINTSVPTVEDVQAIALVAAYSENGFVLIATALRFAIQIGLPLAVDQLIAKSHARPRVITTDEQNLYRLSRAWHGICNLELLSVCHMPSRRFLLKTFQFLPRWRQTTRPDSSNVVKEN